ncbi:DUF4062 domain-containing protein [Vibrio rhodolitus]|uniref:DUF4062 domain-containing protein n=1 Tax=Vibrio rhodolitus TaxID=2231649 RepID=UPI000E09FDAF|nr:DUF4062 domain-containing protein [Vibrio rhodolitus]
MSVKHQVFVSSTYLDLVEERRHVTQTLLEADCIPVVMELFPASNVDQWSFIKSMIDESDYYVLILAGRYGSLSSEGISYTEKEYRYALETGKPIISFLYENVDALTADKCERDPSSAEKLQAFRALAEKKLCKYWENTFDLRLKISNSIYNLKRTHPRGGWVKESSPLELVKQPDKKLNLFFSTPFTTLTDVEYSELRSSIVDIAEDLREFENVDDVYYINEGFESLDDFVFPNLKASAYFNLIDNCDYFIAVLSKRLFSSVHFEAGYALAKGKRCIFFVKEIDNVTFVNELCAADFRESVNIIRYRSFKEIKAFICNEVKHELEAVV